MLSAYDYWQFWRNTDDRDVIRFLTLFTDLGKKEIETLEKENTNNINETKSQNFGSSNIAKPLYFLYQNLLF